MATSKSIEQKTVTRKWQFQYNWKNPYRFLRAAMIKLPALKETRWLIDNLMAKIYRSFVAIKPARKFAGNTGNRTKKTRTTSHLQIIPRKVTTLKYRPNIKYLK